jgi:hypothetical protein
MAVQFALDSKALVRHNGTSLSVLERDIPRAPTKPLWRKREVLRQERIVHYTTVWSPLQRSRSKTYEHAPQVDVSGQVQELVETERSETEVLHMECRQTGEFAHRETTEYEQTETFNRELVSEEKGVEEYVHMKNLEDEYEYRESSMPRQNRSSRTDTREGEGSHHSSALALHSANRRRPCCWRVVPTGRAQ